MIEQLEKVPFTCEQLLRCEEAIDVIASRLVTASLINHTESRLLLLASHVLFHVALKDDNEPIGDFSASELATIDNLFHSHFDTPEKDKHAS